MSGVVCSTEASGVVLESKPRSLQGLRGARHLRRTALDAQAGTSAA